MGSSCYQKKHMLKEDNIMNEGENFIINVINQTNLSRFTIIELYKLLLHTDSNSISENQQYIDFNHYIHFTQCFLYERLNNEYYEIHSIIFSLIGSSFEFHESKINALNILKTLITFCSSNLNDKVFYFISFSKSKLNKENIIISLKNIIIEHLNFHLIDITHEMTRFIMNQGRKYSVNLCSMNLISQAFSHYNIEKFADYILMNALFFLSSNDEIEEEINKFLITKPYLFDFFELRETFLMYYLNSLLN